MEQFKINKCGDSRCKTCPFVEKCNYFYSNSTGVKYFPRTNGQIKLNCKSDNIIYLIYCKICNFQYIGETKNRLQTRFNGHKSNIKSGTSCQLVHKHFQEGGHGLLNCKVIPIEKIDVNSIVSQNLNSAQLEKSISKLRHEREKFWISILQTAYPFGLNSRVKGVGDFNPSQAIFHNFGGRTRRRKKKHSHRKPKRLRVKHDLSLDFILRKHQELSNKDNYIHFFKSFLYGLPRLDLQVLSENISNSNIDERIKDLIKIISHQRLFKPVQTAKLNNRDFYHLNFRDKGIDYINIGSILRSQNVQNLIPLYFTNKEPPVIGYKFNKSIAGKLFNYKDVLSEESLDHYDSNSISCDCQLSVFRDSHHGHVITGNFDIIRNETLKTIIKKGPKYRLPQKINWTEDKSILLSFLDTYIDKWINKEKKLNNNTHLDRTHLDSWKRKILEIIDNKIASGKIRFRKTWSLKIEGNVKKELDRLKEKYVITVTDKAQNNVLFTCKKYYISVVREELTKPGQLTYQLSNKDAASINNDIISFSNSKGIKVPDSMIDIPLIYWIPKMHKNPIGKRFIAGSKLCSLKLLSKYFSKALKLILNHMKLYSNTVFQRSNLNYYWIIDNSLEFMNKINDQNIYHMETFDFSTLYTALPHAEIKKNFSKIFQKVYNREAKPFINVNYKQANFSLSKSNNSCSLRVEDMMEILEFILDNIFVKHGNMIFQQTIGIPIGLDSGQDIANLLLFSYESDYVEKISKEDLGLARNFSLCSRYIDDLFVANFQNFKEHIYKIYPRELEIKSESENPKAVSYLDLKIISKEEGLDFSVYDKRDDFTFVIVNFPYIDSCIPIKSAFGVFYSQLIRYARINTKFSNFSQKSKTLIDKLLNQGYTVTALRKISLRFFKDKHDLISNYNVRNANDFMKSLFHSND